MFSFMYCDQASLKTKVSQLSRDPEQLRSHYRREFFSDMMFGSESITFTFDLRRQYSGRSESGEEIFGDTQNDLFTFLSTVQSLDIPFLFLTSQTALSAIGIGGTAIIDQSQVSRDGSLAYKKIREEDKSDPENVYKLLLSEVSVLGHPAIRYRPNLVELLGIGWEVTSDDEVWPVLVFQKSHFGDLGSFATSEIGRQLRLSDRAEICGNILCAVADMHVHGIVHGDLKPSNVLVYKDMEDTFSGKVADFGYSSCVSGHGERIFVPESWPWNAPEHSAYENVSGRYEKTQAQKMDIYSAGLICLWFLFEPYFAGVKPLPDEVQWAQDLFTVSGEPRSSSRIIESVKREKQAARLACELLQVELLTSNVAGNEFDDVFWSRVLASLLDHNDKRRSIGLFHILQEAKAALKEERLTMPGEFGFAPRNSLLDQKKTSSQFEVIQSLHDLYRTEYQVRRYIVRCMEHRYSDTSRKHQDAALDHLALQLAFCYRIGFGIQRDEAMVQKYLREPQTEGELKDLIQKVATVSLAKMQRPTWVGTTPDISVGHSAPHTQFKSSLKVKETIKAVEQEILDFESSIPNSLLMTIHREYLAQAHSYLGQWRKAIDLTKTSLRIREDILGGRTAASLSAMMNLISYYRSDGQWRLSEEIGRESLSLCRENYKETDQQTLMIKVALASTLISLGNQSLASKLVQEVLDSQREMLGSNHPDTVRSIASLASITRLCGDATRALEMEEQVVKIRTETLGQNHVDTLISKSNLALVYKEQGCYTDAEKILIDVIKAKEFVLDGEHPSLLIDYGNLAAVYWYLGKAVEATALIEKTIKARHKFHESDHPEMLISLSNLASAWWTLGKWHEAKALEEDVLKIRQEIHPEHPETLTCMANLAATLSSLREWKQAEELNKQVISKRETLFGPEHPDTIQAIVNMGGILSSQRRWAEAEPIEIHALNTRVKILGAEHPDTLKSMANLATTWRNLDKLDKAEYLETQVLIARQNIHGPHHKFTLQAMGNLATTYWRLGKLEDAEKLEVHVLNTQIDSQGIEHPETLACMYDLACTYKSMGKDEDAEALMLHVVEVRRKRLPGDHPDLRLAVQTLEDFRAEEIRHGG